MSTTEVWDSKTTLELIRKKMPFSFSPHMTSLELNKSSITNTGAMQIAYALKGNNTLQKLYVKGEKISDLGTGYILNALRENTTLTSLGFEANKISDHLASDVAYLLKYNTTITELTLSQTHLSEKGAQLLASQWKDNTTLLELHLSDNKILDEGASSLISVLKNNYVLRALSLDGGKIGDGPIVALHQALAPNRTLTYLSLNDNVISDVGISEIAQLLNSNPLITTLNIAGNKMTEKGTSYISNMIVASTSLVSLDLSRSQLKDTGLFYLTGALKMNSTLKNLLLSENMITDKSCSNLCDLISVHPTLASLNLSGNKIEDKGCFEILITLKKTQACTNATIPLLTLDLSSNLITDAGALAVLDSAPAIQTLVMIEGNPITDEALLARIQQHVEKFTIDKRITYLTKEIKEITTASGKQIIERIQEVTEKSQKMATKKINKSLSPSTREVRGLGRRTWSAPSAKQPKLSKKPDVKSKKKDRDKINSGEYRIQKLRRHTKLISRLTQKFSPSDEDNLDVRQDPEREHLLYSTIVEKVTSFVTAIQQLSSSTTTSTNTTTTSTNTTTPTATPPIERDNLTKVERKISKIETLVKQLCFLSNEQATVVVINSKLEALIVSVKILLEVVGHLDNNVLSNQQTVDKRIEEVIFNIKKLMQDIQKLHNQVGAEVLHQQQMLEIGTDKEDGSNNSASEGKEVREEVAGSMREKAFAELVTTEETYGAGITLAIAYWLKPLRANLDQMKPSHKVQLTALFASLESIYTLHLFVLEQLKNKRETLGTIFLKISETLKLYIDYVNKFDKATTIFSELVKDKFFVATEQKGFEHTGKYLRDYLITPIQRLPRYQLALETVIKYTEPTHDDYANLVKSLNKMISVNQHINEKKRDYENRLRVLELYSRVSDLPSYIIAPHRVCLFDGILEMEKEGGEPRKLSQVYLLNDLLVITEKVAENELKYTDKIAISDIYMTQVTSEGFSFTAGNVTWNCFTKSQSELLNWTRAIDSAIRQYELNNVLGQCDEYEVDPSSSENEEQQQQQPQPQQQQQQQQSLTARANRSGRSSITTGVALVRSSSNPPLPTCQQQQTQQQQQKSPLSVRSTSHRTLPPPFTSSSTPPPTIHPPSFPSPPPPLSSPRHHSGNLSNSYHLTMSSPSSPALSPLLLSSSSPSLPSLHTSSSVESNLSPRSGSRITLTTPPRNNRTVPPSSTSPRYQTPTRSNPNNSTPPSPSSPSSSTTPRFSTPLLPLSDI